MAIRLLTSPQHQEVLKRLISLARCVESTRYHPAGAEYTSIMVCFLLHNISAAEALVRLSRAFGDNWFPATVGYNVVRSMGEKRGHH